MNNLARWMVALGVVAGSVGFTLLGLGLSYVQPESSEITMGWMLMAGGTVVGLLGWLVFKQTQGPDTADSDPGRTETEGLRH